LREESGIHRGQQVAGNFEQERKVIMLNNIKPTVLYALLIALGFSSDGSITAQTLTTLHGFTNSDGIGPLSELIISGSTLYGTTYAGGGSGRGSVFKVDVDGTGFTNLYSFLATTGPTATNRGGAAPHGALLLSSNMLYGTTPYGGAFGSGTIFKINTNGTGFTNLYDFTFIPSYPNFTNSDGGHPNAGLIVSGNTLYGTTEFGGRFGYGGVFKINLDGSAFTNLHSMDYYSDGAQPRARLLLSGTTLYGTTVSGGSFTDGTVFAINTDGTGFTNLHSFTARTGPFSTNLDGAYPEDALASSGNSLYGTASAGGAYARGTVFKLDKGGTNFTTLHNFTRGLGAYETNNDGATPGSELIVSGNTLYGTASAGGIAGRGIVFVLNTDGTAFTNLHSFTDIPGPFNTNSDGAIPVAGMILSGENLYGTTSYGGNYGNGTVFSVSSGLVIPPQLNITLVETNVLLTWATNYSGFTLQSTTNLFSPAMWTPVSPAPVIVNGLNTVTNPSSDPLKFYRLSNQ
jgi:uncharacterized repeat protein (TIGR03803 family)